MEEKGNIIRVIKYFGAPKKFMDNLYQQGGKEKFAAAYIDEAINCLKIDPLHPMAAKVKGIKIKYPVFRIKCKRHGSYRIFYTWGKENIVVLEIDLRDERTYSKGMLNKLKTRVRIAEEQGFLK